MEVEVQNNHGIFYCFIFQEQLLRQHLIETPEVPISQSQSSEMTSATDPFLGQSTNPDNHARQESADSGLGE